MDEGPICFGFIGKQKFDDEAERELLTLLGQLIGAAGWHLYCKPNGQSNTTVIEGYKAQTDTRPVVTADPFTADPLVVYPDDALAKALSKRRPGWDKEDAVVVVRDIDSLSKLVSATQLYASGAIGGSTVDGGGGSGAAASSTSPL